MSLPLGDLAGRYRVERELGAGGMATVYLAVDLRHDRKVAIKVLRPELAAAIGRDRFLREIATTAALRHPHILPLYDSGEADGLLFYAMPFVDGESLRDRLNRERQLPLDDALAITREVAEALDYANEAGVIHRDIKPENILLERGHAVVADFGIARAVDAASGDRLTSTGLAIGTPAYMSPEQAMGQNSVDRRSDLYALGSVLFEMLAGEPPFTGPTPQSITAKRMMQPAPQVSILRDTVPPAVEAALAKVLSRSPADRFPTAAAFVAALSAPATAAPSIVPSRRSRWLLAGMVLVASLAAGWLLRPRSGRQTAAPAAPSGPPRVSVAVFENRTGDSTLERLGTMVADWVMRGITRVPQLEVVDIGALYTIGRTASGAPTEARALAGGSGATLAVSGAFYSTGGDRLQFSAQVVDVTSGRVLRQVDDVEASRADPLAAAEELKGRLASALASIVNPQAVILGTVAARPPRYDAFEQYIRGQEIYWAGRFDEALPYMQRAIALDPDFNSALVFATVIAAADRCPLVDSLATRIDREGRQLTELERLTVNISQARCRSDWLEALRLQRRRVELLPGASYARWAAGLSARLANRPAEALTILEGLDPSRDLAWLGTGRTFYWRERTAALHSLGRFDAELALADSIAVEDLSPIAAAYFRGRALAGLGRADEAVAAMDRAGALSSDPALVAGSSPAGLRPGAYASPGWAMRLVASELVAHGQPEAGRRLVARAIQWFRTRPPASLTLEDRYNLGQALVLVGEDRDARAVYEVLARERPASLEVRGLVGFVAARAGDRAAARAATAWLTQVASPSPPGLAMYYLAAIATAQGDTARALDLIERLPGGAHPENFLLFHTDPLLAGIRETARFQRFLRPRG